MRINQVSAVASARASHIRYLVLFMLFVVTTLNYADRATLSIVGSSMKAELGLDPVMMGYIFSAFSWAYVMAQLPGGWLLDRFGSKRVYAVSIFLWSFFTLLQAGVGWLSTGLAVAASFPANGRIVASWFPTAERGVASAIFNSAQYFAAVLFTPLMAWIAHTYNWHSVFVVMGGIGIALSVIWVKLIHGPKEHPLINRAELHYIEQGGALVNMDQRPHAHQPAKDKQANWAYVRQLLSNRMLLGVYIGQYCINTITYFFLTWFPVYLVQERGMSILKAGFVASIPAVCGFIGGVVGGMISDRLIQRGVSLTLARKIPIVAGMLLSTTMILCNYVDAQSLVVALMALAFFGKGVGALGWAVVADTAPKEIVGLSGSLFNMFGNVAGITTPIVIGYILKASGSFSGALVFVGANALVTVISYLVIVKEIKRVQLKPVPA